jgi:hypothetical protein
MSDTIREIIIKDFMTRLAVITIANGYRTGIGANVLRARKKVDPDEVPGTVLFPGTEKSVQQYGTMKCTMTIRIEGLALFGAENPSVVSERILGDLKKCILAPANLLTSPVSGWVRTPDYIDGLIYTEGGTEEYPEDGQTTAAAFAGFEVSYTTKINDPYSQ